MKRQQVLLSAAFLFLTGVCVLHAVAETKHSYNGTYRGEYLNRVAIPLGGIGAGMVCLEGTGVISHVSVRGNLELTNEPCLFGAICVKGSEGNVARVLEGLMPTWKYYGIDGAGCGSVGKTYGLPRFAEAEFLARFPFGIVKLKDAKVPLDVELTGWSSFVPGDADNSSLPVAALEYRFVNTSGKKLELVFSWHSKNFLKLGKGDRIRAIENGFVLSQEPISPAEDEAAMAMFVLDEQAVVDHKWIRHRSGFDHLTIAWQSVEQGKTISNPERSGAEGASLYVPFFLEAGQEKVIRVLLAWYAPYTGLYQGQVDDNPTVDIRPYANAERQTVNLAGYIPWYAGRFKDVFETARYWKEQYEDLRGKSMQFRNAFYAMTLPPEAVEAVAANLSILKTPTVLRQTDGRLWCWEGLCDKKGCCAGSCTHVWNYSQAIAHLFPELEKSLRHTEFNELLHQDGSQAFRVNLPIRPGGSSFKYPIDGQLGGIMKMYRDWRISGDTAWLRDYWPRVRLSLDFVIRNFDPRGKGLPEEEHHNTYDIEFYGPNGYSGSYYVGALAAAIRMGEALNEDVENYRHLLGKAQKRIEGELFNGEYFIQNIMKEELQKNFEPLKIGDSGEDTRRIIEQINEQGPVYQYGTGCLSDGIIGLWMARMCGLEGELLNPSMVKSHLQSVYRYNLRHDLFEHVNPQRPSYALGHEGGLLLCTWPKGGKLTLPFIYSNEVWTGIEYQAAEHLILEGMVKEGLEIVRIARDRYDGRVRNPFDEYECGHWYGRALSSYGLLQALTGVRYDAVDKTLYIDSRIGNDFTSFLATASGYGNVGLKNGKPFIDIAGGKLDVQTVMVSGKKAEGWKP